MHISTSLIMAWHHNEVKMISFGERKVQKNPQHMETLHLKRKQLASFSPDTEANNGRILLCWTSLQTREKWTGHGRREQRVFLCFFKIVNGKAWTWQWGQNLQRELSLGVLQCIDSPDLVWFFWADSVAGQNEELYWLLSSGFTAVDWVIVSVL